MIWALIGTAFGFLALWLLQLAAGCVPPLPRPRRTPGPRVPHWARAGHLPSPSAAAGRHRRKATR